MATTASEVRGTRLIKLVKKALAILGCTAWSALAAGAQTLANAPLFEVASVRSATRAGAPQGLAAISGIPAELVGFRGGPGTASPGRINYTGVSLKMLIERAYDLRPKQISGPDWLDTELYDVAATLPSRTDADGLRLMLQSLLTGRFQISLHREMRVLPVYSLTVAKNGPKLQPAEKLPEYINEEERAEANRVRTAAAIARLDVTVARIKAGERVNNSTHLPRATLTKFAEKLSSLLDHPVEDHTQLEGIYAFTLSWLPDRAYPLGGTAGSAELAETPSGPSIFSAVVEQLGLRLRLEKEPIEVLVIDKAEKVPTSN